ncbi:hypothetical protein BJ085DRAFT_35831, partial [Dimargaris cristalligena]
MAHGKRGLPPEQPPGLPDHPQSSSPPPPLAHPFPDDAAGLASQRVPVNNGALNYASTGHSITPVTTAPTGPNLGPHLVSGPARHYPSISAIMRPLANTRPPTWLAPPSDVIEQGNRLTEPSLLSSTPPGPADIFEPRLPLPPLNETLDRIFRGVSPDTVPPQAALPRRLPVHPSPGFDGSAAESAWPDFPRRPSRVSDDRVPSPTSPHKFLRRNPSEHSPLYRQPASPGPYSFSPRPASPPFPAPTGPMETHPRPSAPLFPRLPLPAAGRATSYSPSEIRLPPIDSRYWPGSPPALSGPPNPRAPRPSPHPLPPVYPGGTSPPTTGPNFPPRPIATGPTRPHRSHTAAQLLPPYSGMATPSPAYPAPLSPGVSYASVGGAGLSTSYGQPGPHSYEHTK